MMAESEPGNLPLRVDGITFVNRPVASPPQLPQIPEIPNADATTTSPHLACITTVTALSFHSLFEGFALGFQKTAVGTCILLLAVAIHKFVIAFIIGIEGILGGSKMALLLTCMFVFSVMSPVAMALAMAFHTAGNKMPNMVVGTTNCLAAGTLLYVTFYVIFRRKTKNICCNHFRFVGLAVGAAIMAALQFATSAIKMY